MSKLQNTTNRANKIVIETKIFVNGNEKNIDNELLSIFVGIAFEPLNQTNTIIRNEI